MPKLTPALKQMLAGLASQDLADYLPLEEKLASLGVESQPAARQHPGTEEMPVVVTRPGSHQRIALLADGGGFDAALEFAIDACRRQDASLDLVIPGPGKARDRLARQLTARGRRGGVITRLIPLASDEIQQLTEYVRNHPTLVYVVTTPGNELARQFMELMLPAKRNRLTVPLVMIGEQPVQQLKSVSTL